MFVHVVVLGFYSFCQEMFKGEKSVSLCLSAGFVLFGHVITPAKDCSKAKDFPNAHFVMYTTFGCTFEVSFEIAHFEGPDIELRRTSVSALMTHRGLSCFTAIYGK